MLVVAALNLGGLLLGRGAFIPVVNMCTMVLTCIYVVCCTLVLTLRAKAHGAAAWKGVGGLIAVATVCVSVMALVALVSPFWRGRGRACRWNGACCWGGAWRGWCFWLGFVRTRPSRRGGAVSVLGARVLSPLPTGAGTIC
ncbi:MAG: hypothetical protein WDM92_07900 [Caulobacteraceae bacterium]